jgi:hypothetical protein
MPVMLDRADTGGAASISPLQGPGQAPNGQFDATGQFTSYGLVLASISSGCHFPSVDGHSCQRPLADATPRTPLDVESADVSGVVLTFTDRPTELSGAVHDAQGRAGCRRVSRPVPGSARELDGFRIGASKTPRGESRSERPYHIAGLPPGDGCCGGAHGRGRRLAEPNFLSGLSQSATRVTVTDGEKKTLDLTMTVANRTWEHRAMIDRPGMGSRPTALSWPGGSSLPHGLIASLLHCWLSASSEPASASRRACRPCRRHGIDRRRGRHRRRGARPIRKALVSMTGAGRGSTANVVVTDDGGRFVLSALAGGRYQLTASKPGYVNARAAQRALDARALRSSSQRDSSSHRSRSEWRAVPS